MSEKSSRRSTPAQAFRVALVLTVLATVAKLGLVVSAPGFPGDSEAYTTALVLSVISGAISLVMLWVAGVVIIGVWRWVFG